jgi:hypothetical protein
MSTATSTRVTSTRRYASTVADDLDALFALPPEEFTAARDRLAKATEDRDAARAIKALRRPTVAAWVVNQTVRRHRDALERLLTAGREVRAAQRRAASGLSAPAFGKAIAERRRLVGELTDLATAVLTEAGRAPEPQTRAIANTFEAAAADDSAAEAVAEGRLSKELTPPTGFEILGGFELVEGQSEAAEEAGARRPDLAPARAARQAEKWRTRLATAREELRAAERAAEEAARHVADLERDLGRARGEAESAETKRARIERRAEEAERKLEEASGGEP